MVISSANLRQWGARQLLYMGYGLVAFGLLCMGVTLFGALIWVSSEWPSMPGPGEHGADDQIAIWFFPLFFGTGYGVTLLGRLLVATASRLSGEEPEHIQPAPDVNRGASADWLKMHILYAGHAIVALGFITMGVSVLSAFYFWWTGVPDMPLMKGTVGNDVDHALQTSFWRIPLYLGLGYGIVLLGRLVVAAARR